MVSPSARSYGQQLAGQLSKFWHGGAGPTAAAIDSAFLSVGIDPLSLQGNNKQQRVQYALMTANNQTAVDLTEELLELLRDGRHISAGGYPDQQQLVEGLRQALTRLGGNLDPEGYVTWPAGELPNTAPVAPIPRPEFKPMQLSGLTDLFQQRPAGTPLFRPPAGAVATPPVAGVMGPSIDFLVQMLRHVPQAARSLRIRTRVGKESLPLVDEYDLQDLTSFALRLLYRDVRPEEHTPSYAGKSSRTDFLVKDLQAAVEVKVTYPRRTERDIGQEIVIDQRYYQAHPNVSGVLAVVYDLAGTFTNIPGFEQDLAGVFDGIWTRTVVVPWPPATR
jgi:hypothetical protein